MADASMAAPLDEYRWKHRVLVVVAPTGNADADAQRAIYNASGVGMSERSVILIEARGHDERSQQIRSRLNADGNRFQVFLIGKDGHTAISATSPFTAAELFGRIDAMPMRRDEMQRKR